MEIEIITCDVIGLGVMIEMDIEMIGAINLLSLLAIGMSIALGPENNLGQLLGLLGFMFALVMAMSLIVYGAPSKETNCAICKSNDQTRKRLYKKLEKQWRANHK